MQEAFSPCLHLLSQFLLYLFISYGLQADLLDIGAFYVRLRKLSLPALFQGSEHAAAKFTAYRKAMGIPCFLLFLLPCFQKRRTVWPSSNSGLALATPQ